MVCLHLVSLKCSEAEEITKMCLGGRVGVVHRRGWCGDVRVHRWQRRVHGHGKSNVPVKSLGRLKGVRSLTVFLNVPYVLPGCFYSIFC